MLPRPGGKKEGQNRETGLPCQLWSRYLGMQNIPRTFCGHLLPWGCLMMSYAVLASMAWVRNNCKYKQTLCFKIWSLGRRVSPGSQMGFILRSKVLLPLEIDSSKKWHPATTFGSTGTANDSNAGKTYVANLYNESFEAVYSSLASLSSAIISQYCPTTRCWGYMRNPAAAASHQALQISRSPWTCAFLRHQMLESQPLSFRHWSPDIGPMLS